MPVCDLGCGEGALLQVLLNDTQFGRLAGVDPDRDALADCHAVCQPSPLDFSFLRELPITLDLFQGSLARPDARLVGFDALTCVEVIEHLDPGVLGLFPTVVFGFYAPRVAVVTTPNAEFNVNFPNLGYGTPDAVLRDADHRFEWTRAEFQEWAAMCAGEFGYSVEFHGIGRLPPSDNPAPDTSDTGACTQAAVFTRHDDPASIKMRSDALVGWLDPNEDPYELQLFSTTEFPYFEQDGFSDDVIVAELRHCVEYAVRLAPDKAGSAIPAGTVVPLDHIWDLLQIRQLCKRLPRLVEALESPAAGEYFALTKDPDEVEILFEIAAKEMPDHTHDDVGYTSEETEHASDSDQQTDHSSDGGGSKLKVQSGHGALPAPSARENVPVAPQDNWGTTFEVDTSLENGW